MTHKNLFFAILISFLFLAAVSSCNDSKSETKTETESADIKKAKAREKAALESLEKAKKEAEAWKQSALAVDGDKHNAQAKSDSLTRIVARQDSLLKVAQTPVAKTPASRRTIAQPADSTQTPIAATGPKKKGKRE